jgi:hypothetical protein
MECNSVLTKKGDYRSVLLVEEIVEAMIYARLDINLLFADCQEFRDYFRRETDKPNY